MRSNSQDIITWQVKLVWIFMSLKGDSSVSVLLPQLVLWFGDLIAIWILVPNCVHAIKPRRCLASFRLQRIIKDMTEFIWADDHRLSRWIKSSHSGPYKNNLNLIRIIKRVLLIWRWSRDWHGMLSRSRKMSHDRRKKKLTLLALIFIQWN